MRKDIEIKAYDFIAKHEKEIMNIARTTFIQNKDEHEVKVETLGLIIDELLDYIAYDNVTDAVFDKINKTML